MWTYSKCLGLTQKKNQSLLPNCAPLPASVSPVLKQSWLHLQNLHPSAQWHRLTKTSHCGELTRFKKVDSTVDLCFLVHVPLILHHPSSEQHCCCTCDTASQFWPPKNPEQWSKPAGLEKKKKGYFSFNPYSSSSPNPNHDLFMTKFHLLQKLKFNLFQNILVAT